MRSVLASLYDWLEVSEREFLHLHLHRFVLTATHLADVLIFSILLDALRDLCQILIFKGIG